MAGREDDILALVGQIYDAAVQPSLWPGTLERFSHLFRAVGSAFFVYDPTRDRVLFSQVGRLDGDLICRYDEHYVHLDLRLHRFLRSARQDVVLTDKMLVDENEDVRSEYYNDFLEPAGLRHLLVGVPVRSERRLAWVSVNRSPRQGPFGNAETSLMQTLSQHFRRAVELQDRQGELEARSQAGLNVLDQLSTGIVLLDRALRTAFVNQAAREILDANDGLSLERDGLHAGSVGLTSELWRLIRASGDGLDEGRGVGGSLTVLRPSSRRPYSVLIAPLTNGASPLGLDTPGSAVAVFISDPERRTEASPEVLRRLHGFTRAEAAMAALLLEGSGLEEAANRLGVSIHTARSQLKSLFGKTDTHRQAELVRLLITAVAGVRSTHAAQN